MSEWTEVNLGELLTRRTDFTPVDPDKNYVILGVQRSGWGFVRRNPIRGSDQKFSKLLRVAKDDLVYRTITAFEAPSAVAGLAEDGLFVTPQTFPVFRLDHKALLPDFMRILTTSPMFHHEMAIRCTGTVLRRKTLSIGAFAEIPVMLPPLDEQRRIVDVMSAVDAQVNALADEVTLLDAIWGSLGAQMVDTLAGATTVRLDEVADISGGITKNKKDHDRPDLVEVPYLRVANVHRRYLDLTTVATIMTTPSKASALRLLPGDVLFNEGGDRDKLGRGDVWRGQIPNCIHQNHVFRARVTDPGFDPRFVSAWGNTFGKGWFETFGTQTTGIASINKQTLSRFPLPDVSRAVQESWADRMDEVVHSHNSVSDELATLRNFRSALLSSLLNQDIEIPDSYDSALEEVA